MTLSEKMIDYRAKYNISQEEFANKCKLCLMTVNAIENGKREPNKLTKAKIEQLIENKEE